MTSKTSWRAFAEVGLLPVVRAESPAEAARVIDAIRAGGVPILEITMTVPGAVHLIEELSGRFGADAVVGAGTVLDPETARACILAGAQFVVSPALEPRDDRDAAAATAWPSCRGRSPPPRWSPPGRRGRTW